MARNTLTVTINGKQFVTKPANDASNSLKKLGATSEKVSTMMKVGLAAAAALAVREIVAFGKASVTAASDAEETWNKYSVVFSKVMGDAGEAMANLSDNYGLSSKMAQQLLSDTGDLLTGFGFTQESALDLSSQVNELAVDLASFTNFSGGAEGASVALTKALLGERESIKSLGISIQEADIKQLAEDKGITGTLDRQTKAMLTLELAVKQSKNAIGDFERSQDSFANQNKILQSNIDDLKVAIGERLLPTVTNIVVGFNSWFDSINKTKDAVAALSEEIGEASGNDLKLLESTLGLLLGNTEDVVEAVKQLSEATGISIGYLYQMALASDVVDDKFKDVLKRILDTKDAIVSAKEGFLDFSSSQNTTTTAIVNTIDELIKEKVALHAIMTQEERDMNAAIDSAWRMAGAYEHMAFMASEAVAELKEMWRLQNEQGIAVAAADQSGARYAAQAGGSQYTPKEDGPSGMETFLTSIVGAVSSLDSLKAILDPITTIFSGIMEVLGPAIDQLLAPLVGILKVLGNLIGSLLVPVIQLLAPIIEAVAKIFIWLYNKILLPVGNGIIRVFKIVQNQLIGIINAVIKGINWALGWLGVNISEMQSVDINSGQLQAIDMTTLSQSGGISGSTYAGSTSGSSSSIQSVNITVNQYFEGNVIGDGGMEQVGEFVTKAIQSYAGVGGNVSLVTA